MLDYIQWMMDQDQEMLDQNQQMVVDDEERYLQNQTMTPKRSWLTDFLASLFMVAELGITGQSSPFIDGQGCMSWDSCHTSDDQEVMSGPGTPVLDKIGFRGHFSFHYWTELFPIDCCPAIGGQDCIQLTDILQLVDWIEFTALLWLVDRTLSN